MKKEMNSARNKEKRFISFFRRKKKRILQIVGGHGIYAVIGWFFDNPLYIYVLAAYGSLVGGSVMTFLSLIISAGLMVIYNHTKIDWLGMNVLEEIKNEGHVWVEKYHSKSIYLKIAAFIPVKIFQFIIWSLKKGDFVAFFVLSIFEDPFITVVYLRHGSFESIKKKEWGIFLASVVVSNGYWIIRNTAIIEAVKLILKSILI